MRLLMVAAEGVRADGDSLSIGRPASFQAADT
jgi:hypothetical protein